MPRDLVIGPEELQQIRELLEKGVKHPLLLEDDDSVRLLELDLHEQRTPALVGEFSRGLSPSPYKIFAVG